MKRKILVMMITILTIAGTLTSFVAYSMLNELREKAMMDKLSSNISLINDTLEIMGKGDESINFFRLTQIFSGRINERITFFDIQGNALADSKNNSIILKKYDFEEVEEAVKGNVGISRHLSKDSGRMSIFLATPPIKVKDKMIIVRLEGDLEELDSFKDIFLINMTKSLVIGICLSVVIGVVYISRIISPISVLSRATKNVARGEFQLIDLPDTNDEIRELTNDFNAMIINLEKLEKLRSEFVTNVSHEFRTPLTSIMGFVETIRYSEDVTKEEIDKIMVIMEVEIDRLNRLINKLLTLSEIEKISVRNNDEKVNVSDVITSSIELLKPIAYQKKITIFFDDNSNDCMVLGNEDRFKEILINIIDNGIKYSEDKTNICISSFYNKKENKVGIVIADQGIGIAEEEIERVFERFYRVNKSRSRSTGGTGLGLSIVKHCVKAMNGKISVESTIGKGTKFILEFDGIN